MARVITIASGKGGVGKTSLSLNLALSFAARGKTVCLFDADLGLANVSIMTGIYPERNLEAVIMENCPIHDIMIRDFHGIDIIPGSSGVERIADLTPRQTARLITTFLELDVYDEVIFDTSAGISAQVLSFCMASHEMILVATTEPTSLTDAYALLKVLSRQQYKNPVRVVVNKVKSVKPAQQAYAKLKSTVDQFLKVQLVPLGIMPLDPNMRKAIIAQTPVVKKYPSTPVSKCIRHMAGKLSHNAQESKSLTSFWTDCLSFLKGYRTETAPRQVLPPDALTRIEEQIAALTREIATLKDLLVSEVLRAKHPGVSTASPLDLSTYKSEKRQRPGHGPPLHKADPPAGIARGKLRNPTQEELANWNESVNPVVRLTKAPESQAG